MACALCATDLHIMQHGEEFAEANRAYDGFFTADRSRPVILGHELCCEIIDYGPNCQKTLPVGARVTSLPLLFTESGPQVIGQSDVVPGGFGEYLVLDESLMREVPRQLSSSMASMIEPFAVGCYYARISKIQKEEVALVVGCGAIGLAVVAALNAMDHHPIIAADFSPERRELALRMGADSAIDPREESPYTAGIIDGSSKPPSVVFECVGIPGVLNNVFLRANWGSRIYVAGVCTEDDHLCTHAAHTKGLQVMFGGGEHPEDIDLSIRLLNEGKVDLTPWFGRTIGLSELESELLNMNRPGAAIRNVLDPFKA